MSNQEGVENCKICTEILSEDTDVVCCNKCGGNYHRSCVVLNDNMDVWKCPQCVSQKLQPPAPPKSKSRRSVASANAIQLMEQRTKILAEQEDLLKEQELQRQKLAEEDEKLFREMEEKRKQRAKEMEMSFLKRKELLQQKQKIVEETIHSVSGSSKSSSKGSVDFSIKRTEDWVHNKMNHQSIVDPAAVEQPPTIKPPAMSSTIKVPAKEPTANKDVNQDSTRRFHLSSGDIAARHVIKALPKFDGDPKVWSRFISAFERASQMCNFSNDENLERLRDALSGSALAAVEYRLNDGLVDEIMTDLRNLFGRPEFIISDLLSSLRKESNPTIDDVDSIVRFGFQVNNICSTMRSAKLSEHLWDPNLLLELESKLPPSIKLEWAVYKHSSPSKCNIESFAAWIKQRADSYICILKKPPNLLTSANRNRVKQGSSVNVHEESAKLCPGCSKSDSHHLEDCEAFKSKAYSEKWKIVKTNSVCRICLSSHKLKKCKVDRACGEEGCQYHHHKLLHKFKIEDPAAVNVHSSTLTSHFKVLPVVIESNGHSIETYAMLDDGSSITIIDKDLADELHLNGEPEPLCLRWTTGINKRDESSESVSFTIKSKESKFFTLTGVRTLKNMKLPTQSLDVASLAKNYSYLQNLPLECFNNITPKILIGNDHCKLSMVLKYKCGGAKDPVACKTRLGWTICGSTNSQENYSFHISKCTCVVNKPYNSDENLEALIKEHYKIENLGITSKGDEQMTSDEKRANAILESSTIFKDDQYEVGLLWKFESIKVPSSYQMAKRRLLCLEKRYKDEPQMLDVINDQITDYVRKGYSVKLSPHEVKSFGNDCWYLPTFVVRNVNKPSKIRLVWDAAAEVNGVSLNKMLLKGPDMLTNLSGILIRFREYRIAIAGDIREMFHQVKIKDDDQRYQLFLWRNNTEVEPDVYKMRVMTFGATCSPSSAQYVLTTNAKRFEQTKPQAAEAIYTNHYVDDWLHSVEDVDAAISLAKDVKEIHRQGGFQIRNWISNAKPFVEVLNDSNAEDSKNMELSTKHDKVLGLFWMTNEDHFTFLLRRPLNCVEVLEGHKVPTKRQVLRILMSVFDPLGLISHILIYPKILIQMIWRSGIDWDSEINEEHYEHWRLWIKSLSVIENIKIPRWIGFSSSNFNVQLHVFVDASEEGFAAAVFVRVISSKGVQCNLVCAKSKVSPLKPMSIPRLELQAAVIGTRLAKFVNESFSKPVEEQYFWTDSKTVLSWISVDLKKYKQFVSCRVAEIQEYTSPNQWNWICSKNNVADLATKLKFHDDDAFQTWYFGPRFLYEDEETWRNSAVDICVTQEELRPQFEASLNFHSVATPTKFSSWLKLLRSMAYAIRFGKNLLRMIRSEQTVKGFLTKAEFSMAENMLYSQAQAEGYPDEYITLQQELSTIDKHSPIYKDVPFMDANKVIRANSRLEFADVCEAFRKPVLLPKNHAITDLIIHHFHAKYHHHNNETAINEIRQRYVIPCLRTKLKSIKHHCQFCKNKSARPTVPMMSSLPPARLSSFTQPFSFTGVDYFGPMYVAVHRRREKRWMLLFTCLTTRAVHVEVTSSLTTSSCIICLRNFICRRGTPRQIFSDNGTSFKGASNELKKVIQEMDQSELASNFISSETEWIFIPPASPHMGGSWERMVRSIKTTLKAILPEGSISEEVLRSLLCEAEHIVNSRPLTYVPIESENEAALTPNHFLLGSSSGIKPVGQLTTDHNHLKDNWHKAQHLSDLFWRRWTKEYMPTLCRRSKWFQDNRELQLDDIVIIVGETERGKWPKGRIIDLIRSRDNKVRSAKVQTDTGIYERPASKIAVLDVKGDSTPVTSTGIPGGGVANTSDTHHMTLRSHTR